MNGKTFLKYFLAVLTLILLEIFACIVQVGRILILNIQRNHTLAMNQYSLKMFSIIFIHFYTSMRAIRARYDPYLQAIGRIQQLKQLGHSIDKV